MQKFLFTTFVFIIGTLLLFSSLSAQSVLKDFARQRSIQWHSERAKAESIAIAKNMPIRVDREDGTSFELQRFENGFPVYYTTDNLNAAKTVSTNKVWPAGGYGFSLTGDSVTLGEWDAGAPRSTHQEFGGRVLSTQGSLHSHSSHVAGTMIAAGVVGNARGMSNLASLQAFDWNDDNSEMAAQAGAGLRTSNHSYGTITGWYYNYFGDGLWAWFGDMTVSTTEDWKFGYYSLGAYYWDLMARNAPYYLIVKSAGNDRGEGITSGVHWEYINGGWTKVDYRRNKDGNNDGYDCIADESLCKNILTVGAVDDIVTGYNGPSSVVMSSFSSWGPTDDGRIKPDIVANGINLYSTLETADNAYGTMSGTSMASPNVTGSIGLLLELQRKLHGSTPLLSSTLKSIIINTADEAGANPGPDYSYGWGLMNTLNAARLMKLDSIDGPNSHIREIPLNQGDTVRIDFASDGTLPIKATIGWTDLPGIPVPTALDPPNIMLKNDLDLRIIRKRDKLKFYPWVLNPAVPSAAATTGDNIRDNVEQVYIGTPEKTLYTLEITHKGTLQSPPQNVSLAISGNFSKIGPALYTQSKTFNYTLIPDSVIHDSIKIRNDGDTTLSIYSSVPPSFTGWISVKEDSVFVAPLDSTVIHFDVDAGILNTWATYPGYFNLANNDTSKNPSVFNINVTTLGPTMNSSPQKLVSDLSLHQIGNDSLIISNTGFVPLEFAICDTGKTLPSWLAVDPSEGSINPGEIVKVYITFNETDMPIGNYSYYLYTMHNDIRTSVQNTFAELHVGTHKTISTSVHDFWNLVSTPVIPINNLKTSLYPTATSNAYSFNGSYIKQDSLTAGQGIWLKFASAQSFGVDGYVFDKDTLLVDAGWNLIGGLSSDVPLSSVTSEPPDIINSLMFTYNRGYNFADIIQAGCGYWISTKQSGKLFLNGTFPPIIKPSTLTLLDGYNSLIFSDGVNVQTLYFGIGLKNNKSENYFSLPPKPPTGSFDVRFSSGKMAEIISNNGAKFELPIQIQTIKYPVTIHWHIQQNEAMKFSLVDESGEFLPLTKDGSVTLQSSSSEIKEIKLTNEAPKLPTEYSLQQNYPNPFNPSTVIGYELPTAGYVTLKIFNMLGQEIMTLVDGYKEAGYYSVNFDASNFPSGMYVYKMQADKFSSVKKMVLMR